MPSIAATPTYRADPPGSLRMVALEDGLVLLFHRPSATTHVVASPVPELLAALDEGPADATTLLGRLAARHDLDDPDAAALAERLEELAAAGLVARL
ncbi:MAG: HPr-rel-A system PqqD family peptide chaperone [Sphingomonadaceae bacterium]|nr:HPr-rel-A system PqqD family peptide chaperone [Sphingomonadaceae bacterium]